MALCKWCGAITIPFRVNCVDWHVAHLCINCGVIEPPKKEKTNKFKKRKR